MTITSPKRYIYKHTIVVFRLAEDTLFNTLPHTTTHKIAFALTHARTAHTFIFASKRLQHTRTHKHTHTHLVGSMPSVCFALNNTIVVGSTVSLSLFTVTDAACSPPHSACIICFYFNIFICSLLSIFVYYTHDSHSHTHQSYRIVYVDIGVCVLVSILFSILHTFGMRSLTCASKRGCCQ